MHKLCIPAAFLMVLMAATPARAGEARSPYAGEEKRTIKSLSHEETRALLTGAGFGFAKAAELNHYPGPIHVLQIAKRLRLAQGQIERTKSLHGRMKREAIRLGREIVRREGALERLFASGKIDEAGLRSAVSEIARLRGELRTVHLKYHLKMKRLLTPHQVAMYDAIRGYAPAAGAEHRHRAH